MYEISNVYILKVRIKNAENWEFVIFSQVQRPHNSVKNRWIKTILKLDLNLSMAKQCTKYQMNIWKHEQEKCGKLIYRTDGRTECKPKVLSDFVGRGLIRGEWIGRSFGWDLKNRGPVSEQVRHNKDPSLLKCPEHRPRFSSPSPATGTSSYRWKILERDEKS
jgi:hypothetical protein